MVFVLSFDRRGSDFQSSSDPFCTGRFGWNMVDDVLEFKQSHSLQPYLVVTTSQLPTLINVSCSLGDAGYPFAAQQLGLGAEGAKTANKYGEQSVICCDKQLNAMELFHFTNSANHQ